MRVKTRVGELNVPDVASQRAKFWAEALHDLAKPVEVFGVVQAMLDEAYEAGKGEALHYFFQGWAKSLRKEAIDVEFEVVEGKGLEQGGPGGAEATAVSQADGSAELP